MQFGLKEEIIQAVQQVLEQNQHVDKALVFGSRAKGNYKEGSDIDLALKGDLNAKDVLELHGKLDALNLHYKFDLVNYKSISEPALKEHIDRVGMVMYSRWKEHILEDVVEKFIDYRGKTPTKTTSGIPLITAKIVKDGKLLYPNEFIAAEDYDTWMTRGYPEINNVILTTEAPLGEVALIKDKNVALAQRIITIQTKNELCNSIFLKYYFQSDIGKNVLQARASGSTVEGIKSSELKKIKISLPPISDQSSIAEFLISLDDKIDLLNRQNSTLEQLAETLFRQWFVEEAEESWGIATLAEHTEVFRGLSYKGSGLTDSSNGLPMHNLNSVYEFGGYKSDGIKYYKGEYRERHLVNAGDIIVTNTEQGHEYRLIGFPGIVPSSFGTVGLFSQHIYKLVPLKDTYLTNQFLYYLLTTPSVREQIIGATNGSTVNMLAIDGLQRPEFKLPPKQQVKEFSAIITNYWKKKESNHSQIETLTKLRDTLLPKLMSGEIRVDLTDAELAKPVKNKKANIGQ